MTAEALLTTCPECGAYTGLLDGQVTCSRDGTHIGEEDA